MHERNCARARRSPPPPRLLLWLLLLLSPWGLLPPVARAQQSPALQGQGVDPVAAGVVGQTVDVYVTVELAKLLSLDEHDYTFNALFNFDLSWSDPRSKDIFPIIDANYNLALAQSAAQANCSSALNASDNPTVLSSPPCQSAQLQPPPCSKYCTTYGQTTDNRFRCCDSVWLPDIELRNMVDTSQDRIVSDVIWKPDSYPDLVHRSTAVLGRFYTALDFHRYPFDRQRLQLFVDPNARTTTSDFLNLSGFSIVPSGVFWRLDVLFLDGTGRNESIGSKRHDELAGWNINNVSLSCVKLVNGSGGTILQTRPISLQTQGFDEGDQFGNDYDGGTLNPVAYLDQTCALVVDVSRLSSTAVAQSIVPVAFISGLAFLVFATEPDAIDVRLGTEVTLFLSLTAVQFIFVAVLPVASYLTAFDVFILLSYSLLVVIMLENCLVAYICTRKDHLERKHGMLLALGSGRALRNAPAKRSIPETEEQEKQALEEDENSSAELAQESTPSTHNLSMVRRLRGPLKRASLRWADDPAKAYRLACNIDVGFAVVVLVIYVVLSVLIFTVGLTNSCNTETDPC